MIAYVERLSEGGEQAWDDYVAGRPDATLYHLRAWKTAVEKAYHLRTFFLLARDGESGRVRGALPLYRIPRPFSPNLTSGYFGAYGPFLADDAEAGRALVAEAGRLVDDKVARFLHLKILGPAPAWLELPTKSIWVTGFLELGADPDALFQRIGSQQRNEIRRARKEQLTVALGPGEFEGFYDVLSENMARKGTPMIGRPLLKGLLEELAPKATVLTLHHRGRAVSGALLAWHNGVLYMPWASSRPSVFQLRANYLLYWEIFRFGIEKGLQALDFGTSLKGSSGLVFKGKWGTRFEEITSVLYSRGPLPALDPGDSSLVQTGVKVWSKLPRGLTDAIGPTVSRWTA